MRPGGPRCSSGRNKANIWKIVRDQSEDRTPSLQAKEEELKMRIFQMESLLSDRQSDSYCCVPQSGNVPKVFPKKMESPVRDIPTFRDDPPSSFVVPYRSADGDGHSTSHQLSCHQPVCSRTSTPIQTQPKPHFRPQSPKNQSSSPLPPAPPPASTFFQKVMENAKSILTLKCNAVHPTCDERPTREKDVTVYSCNVKRKSSNW